MAEEQTDVASPQLQHKLSKEQKNRSRKQEVNSHKDREMERSREEGSILTHHSIEVDVEILDDSKDQEKCSRTVKPFSKCTSKWQNKRVTTCEDTVPRSPSQASLMSEGAVEELCYLRRYNSSQPRRINYNSHEHDLGQPAGPGVLACIWEPRSGPWADLCPDRAELVDTSRWSEEADDVPQLDGNLFLI